MAVGADGVHRRLVAVRAGDENQAVSGNRRGRRDVAAAGQLPDLAAGLEIVAAGVLPAVDDDLLAAAGVDDRRRAPGRHVAARHAPDFLARRDVEGREERVLLHVGLNDHDAVVDDRRAGESPLRFRCREESGVEHAEVLAPELLAREVVDVQPFRPEDRRQVRAVRGERRVGLRALRVPLHGRHTLVDRLFPPRAPVRLSRQITFHSCGLVSFTGSTSP